MKNIDVFKNVDIFKKKNIFEINHHTSNICYFVCLFFNNFTNLEPNKIIRLCRHFINNLIIKESRFKDVWSASQKI